ncbi:site-specific DNA-methyltransferase [Limosilactobacillus reuteri]|uniref:site-specific DNA-methyltransferase n=1 Tax=Limosilactobacillus reuteri TaxID=1598 RepID=UPI001E46AFD4|nr:site-specific DNA-methyltransferase [Limosilactobacillus reuteri]MCC4399362.1 site-specific DNA-methyltransferase [Limosilactobacillus reuteri]MCC4403379.1 site-specific DNA-methyltransferase [Limosilactobacillus reuteri]
MLRDSEKYNQQVKSNTAFLNELKNKLPEFFTKDGSFDLDKFKNQLKEKNVNELSEGYQLDFIGKDYARRQAGEVSNTVIVPDEKQNQGEGKNSKNLFFTGDNLEVLRHLQNNYQNKVDVIYIDPPYNTGSDGFVYPDSFEYSDDKLKEMFGLDDEKVERLKSIQGKSSHSAWLAFMYPRLVLAKNMLSDKGIIFISIDDNEQDNLLEILNEIYGETNFITNFVWEKKKKPSFLNGNVGQKFEYVVCFAKNRKSTHAFSVEKTQKGKKYPFNNAGNSVTILTFPPKSVSFSKINNDIIKRQDMSSGNIKTELLNDVQIVEGRNVNKFSLLGEWRYSQDRLNEILAKESEITISGVPFRPNLTKVGGEIKKMHNLLSLQNYPVGSNEDATRELMQLFRVNMFDFNKPTSLIKLLVKSYTYNMSSSIVMDFFAGSSTTADAVMQLNAEDGGHRKFIMIQLPEKTYQTNKDGKEVPTKGGKAAYDAGFKSIDEISRERIRRAANKIKEDNELTLPKDFDGSFKHYRVVNPANQTLEDIDDFDPNNTNLFTNMVEGFSSNSLNVAGDASGEQTILTTWLAQDGYTFDTEVEDKQFDNYHAHLVDDRLYLINEGWSSDQTKELLNQLGKNELHLQSIVLFGYSFNIAELRELESGLKQLDSKVTLIKRY